MTHRMQTQSWIPQVSQELIGSIAEQAANNSPSRNQQWFEELALESRRIHEINGVNLNPATNVMNPRAEALLASGMGSRPSLGYPGGKYEMGLQAIEQVEVITAELACELFEANYAEYRIGSGALANLYAFMATCEPGDTIIAPPASIGGHITHHKAGAAGLYHLNTISAPIVAGEYTVDIDALRTLAHEVKPKLITIGASLNLFPHPVSDIREIADEVGAKVLFDAAHLCGMIAGKQWPNPLAQGAHLMTFSTYKSLGGPAGGMLVTNDAELAQRVDAIAYPGLTANFDAAKTAALGVTLQDWIAVGEDYAEMMVATAAELARELDRLGVPIFTGHKGFTMSHQFAVLAAKYGGGQTASLKLEKSGLIACGIGLPIDEVTGDLNGLRIGTPEIARMGAKPENMAALAQLIVDGLTTSGDGSDVKERVTQWRSQFSGVHYTVDLPN
jgi:glycine hydroxymethyltransferase